MRVSPAAWGGVGPCVFWYCRASMVRPALHAPGNGNLSNGQPSPQPEQSAIHRRLINTAPAVRKGENDQQEYVNKQKIRTFGFSTSWDDKSIFGIGWGVREGVRGECTDHTKLFLRTFSEFGLTWHQKVHFSTFDDGHLTM